jgi:hypothetical protein
MHSAQVPFAMLPKAIASHSDFAASIPAASLHGNKRGLFVLAAFEFVYEWNLTCFTK